MSGMWMSPVPEGGGGSTPKPWWDFPTPLGVPRRITIPGECYQETVTPTGETFGAPVGCGPMWGAGHVFTGGFMDAWTQWFRGSEDRPPTPRN